MSPPGDSTATQPDLGADQEGDRQSGYLSVQTARVLTDVLRDALDDVATKLDGITPVIERSKDEIVYGALGYDTWPAYVRGEFGDQLARLARHNRGSVIELLSAEGMSVRGIESAIDVGKSTIDRHLSQSGTPDQAAPTPKKTIGNDGKSYTRPEPKPEPKKPRRRPLPESYRDAAWKTLKSVESLSRWHQDDRFDGNRDAIEHYGPEIARAANELLDLLDDLGIDRHRYGGAR